MSTTKRVRAGQIRFDYHMHITQCSSVTMKKESCLTKKERINHGYCYNHHHPNHCYGTLF